MNKKNCKLPLIFWFFKNVILALVGKMQDELNEVKSEYQCKINF